MKTVLSFAFVFTLSILATQSQAAGDAAAGKTKAAACIACHGVDGISPNDIWPNLKGQKAGYLIKQIKAFRDGKRLDPMMAPMVKALSDQDIEDMAAYFSGQ